MSYQSIKDLPQLIQDRVYLQDHERLFDRICSAGLVPEEKRRDFVELIDAILLQQKSVCELPSLFSATFGIDTPQAENISNLLWSYYFRCFQDFLGAINDRIPLDAQKDSESLMQTLFEVHRQLQDVVAPLLYELGLSEIESACKNELIDILLGIARQSIPESELKVRLADTLTKYRLQHISPEDTFGAFVLFCKDMLTPEVADYYISLSDSILNAKAHPLLRKQITKSERTEKVPQPSEIKQEESLGDRVKKLPEEIQNAILSSSAAERRNALSQRYGVELEDLLYGIALKDIPFDRIVLELRKQRSIKPEIVA